MSDLLIDEVEILDCSDLVGPGDDAQIVAVHGGGLTGWYGPVGAPAAMLIDRCLAALILGAAVADHEELLARLRRRLGTPAGALTSWAIGALDCAVWDLHGRAEDQPVATLLGTCEPQRHVPAYVSWLRLDIRDPANDAKAAEVAADGWLFTKWGLRRRHDLEGGADAAQMAAAAQRVVEAIGAPVAFDALCTWDLALTVDFSGRVHHARMVWLEEPFDRYDPDLHAAAAPSCPPLALGERLQLSGEPTSVLGLAGLGAFTVDVVGCGGLTTAVRAVAASAAAGIPVHPHGRSLLPAVHLAAAFPDAVAAVEYQLPWEPRRQRLFTEPMEHAAGQLAVPSTSGLGRTPRRR